MAKEVKYKALVNPVPVVAGGKVVWGWHGELIDENDVKQTFEGVAEFPTYSAALGDATKSLRAYVRALKDVDVYEVNLDAPDPIIEDEEVEEPAPPVEPEASKEKKTEEPTPEGQATAPAGAAPVQ